MGYLMQNIDLFVYVLYFPLSILCFFFLFFLVFINLFEESYYIKYFYVIQMIDIICTA